MVTSRIAKSAPVNTLAIDVGGTGLKASVLDPDGKMLTDRARIPTTYPVTPTQLVEQLVTLVGPLPTSGRVSVGFPGVVRLGHVRTAPHLVTTKGPGSPVSPALVEQWTGFDLAGGLTGALGKPTRVLNDADLQGLDVMTGRGVEVIPCPNETSGRTCIECRLRRIVGGQLWLHVCSLSPIEFAGSAALMLFTDALVPSEVPDTRLGARVRNKEMEESPLLFF